jgi:hypothetical protein
MNRHRVVVIGLALALSSQALAQSPAVKAAIFTTTDTPISDLIANPGAKAVLDKDIPGMSTNPSIDVVGGMTLRALQPTAPDKLSDKVLDQVDADLAKLPAK